MADERILVIEDAKNIAELVKYNLEREGYKVTVCARGDEGLDKAFKDSPDLIVLDLMLPGMDGIDICKAVRASDKIGSTPILMLTAKGEEMDKVLGLELGADDYMTKPFSPKELVARVKAILRRLKAKTTRKTHRVGELEMDTERHLVSVKGNRVSLTHKEFNLLKILIETHGRVLSRDYLLSRVWGYEESLDIETRTVDMHIGQLRKKLKSEAHRILTVKNEGYRFDDEV
ncbi:MAG: response regulator transcription factor [Candidatus Omnitrophica bacterium]|nr:response regulator transcription factor [Candidatus Omnitrophota bacterium]